MALSPNYSWAEPDNSSLVKNGAADIRTLGDAIDTSVWNVGFGQAAKNKIINGDFAINQRNFSSSTTSAAYGFDRFMMIYVDGTVTYSAQTFTVGSAPVAGYEGKNFARIVTSGQSATNARANWKQPIENVRTLAGQTATVSFWAKAGSGTPKIAVELWQGFGTGGSPSAGVSTYAGQVTLSTSWARYSVTVAVPSIAGKTIGTTENTSELQCNLFVSAGSDLNSRTGSLGIQNNTFDIWGVQVEYGSKATPFQTATGTIQGELAACQRYYWRALVDGAGDRLGVGYVNSTTQANLYTQFPVQMRVAPTALEQSGTAGDYSLATSGGTIICSAVPSFNTATTWNSSTLLDVASGLVAGQGFLGRAVNTNAFLGWSAEL